MSYVQQTNLLQYKNTLYRHFDNRFSVQMNRLSVWMDRQTFAVTKTYNTLDVLNKRRFFLFFSIELVVAWRSDIISKRF